MPRIVRSGDDYNACGDMLRLVAKSFAEVKANSDKPRIVQGLIDKRSALLEMMAAHLNRELIRAAVDGSDVPLLDASNVRELVALVKKWQDAGPATRDYGFGKKWPNVETTLWLVAMTFGDSAKMPPLKPEVAEKIVTHGL